jgi:hypothetical protein
MDEKRIPKMRYRFGFPILPVYSQESEEKIFCVDVAESNKTKKKIKMIYIIRTGMKDDEGHDIYKIGRANTTLKKLISRYKTYYHNMKLEEYYITDNYISKEKEILKKLKNKIIHGEKVVCDLKEIRKICETTIRHKDDATCYCCKESCGGEISHSRRYMGLQGWYCDKNLKTVIIQGEGIDDIDGICMVNICYKCYAINESELEDDTTTLINNKPYFIECAYIQNEG